MVVPKTVDDETIMGGFKLTPLELFVKCEISATFRRRLRIQREPPPRNKEKKSVTFNLKWTIEYKGFKFIYVTNRYNIKPVAFDEMLILNSYNDVATYYLVNVLRTRRFYNGTGILLSHHSLETGSNTRCCIRALMSYIVQESRLDFLISMPSRWCQHNRIYLRRKLIYIKIKGVESIPQDN